MQHMKTALVTGGATGLGREVAVKLAQRGVAVALADMSEAGLCGTAEQIAAHSGACLSLQMDLTAAGAPDKAIDQCCAKWGQLDLLVNNAAFGAIEPFFESSAALWHKTFAINVTALA